MFTSILGPFYATLENITLQCVEKSFNFKATFGMILHKIMTISCLNYNVVWIVMLQKLSTFNSPFIVLSTRRLANLWGLLKHVNIFENHFLILFKNRKRTTWIVNRRFQLLGYDRTNTTKIYGNCMTKIHLKEIKWLSVDAPQYNTTTLITWWLRYEKH